LQITDDPQKHLRYLATQPNIRERLISSMAPSIYGMHYVKTAILLSMMGGQMKPAARRHHYLRGDINVLIVGDPGTAKSQLLKYVEQTAPKTVYTTGKGASAVGLTAAVSRDEQGDVCLQGGAMVLADDGICLIDEFDKLGPSDRSSIHEAMEEQTISISKAGVCTTLKAKCAVIAVANPIEGRFDPERTFAQNVCFSGPILSRFDTLCVLKDEADAEQDERLADHVICSHIRCHEKATSAEKQIKPRRAQEANAIVPIEQELLQQYIVYARTSVFPKITDMNTDRIGEFYKEIREAVKGFGGAPVTSRCINSIVRLAEANARLELRQHVTSRDLDNAISTILESVIQSQNAHVAKQLRQKFSRYGKRQAEPMPQESSQPQATSQPTASQPLSTPLPTGSQAQMAPQPTVLGSRPMPEPQPIPQASSQPQAEQGECGRTKRRKTMPRRFTGGC